MSKFPSKIRISRFWLCYFFIRLFYLFFAIFVYAQLTQLGDNRRYIRANVPFSLRIFHDSTHMVDFFAGNVSNLFREDMLLSNLPATLISFFIIRWAIEKLELRRYVNNILLMITISFPNFSVWTAVWSKELFGLVYTAIIAVLIINFLKGNFKIKIIDFIGLYLCFLFNPQFIPFILQGLIFIFIARYTMLHKPANQLRLSIIFLLMNIIILYLIRDIVNRYAGGMHAHFDTPFAGTTRDNIFLEDYDFFRHLPWGMFIAFFGPTFAEMTENPLLAITGLESLLKIMVFIYLSKYVIINILLKFHFPTLLPISYFMIIMGISFMHYPFGVFNPGSAIRYRSRFVFLFTVLLLYLYSQRARVLTICRKK